MSDWRGSISTTEHNGRWKSTPQGSTSFGMSGNVAVETDVTNLTREIGREGWNRAFFSAFQKSTVFEKVTTHRETVAEGNVFETYSAIMALRT
jgi:hypothetical protein